MTSDSTWLDHNQRFLAAEIAQVRECLNRHVPQHEYEEPQTGTRSERRSEPDGQESNVPFPALEILVRSFDLSTFERAIVLLCAGIELDSSLASLCAAVQGNPARAYPTFSLAMATLANPHWSALSPAGPLRHWRLIEISGQSGNSLTTSRLALDERVLHFLTGVQYLDDRLAALLRPIQPPDEIAASHAAQARMIPPAWRRPQRPLQVVELCGSDEITKRSVAASGCAEIQLGMYALAADQIPASAQELDGFLRLWERESMLTASALYIDTEAIDVNDSKAIAQVSRFADVVQGPVILSTRDHWRSLARGMKTLDIGKPTAKEQETAWQHLLSAAKADVNGHVSSLVGQFNLNLAGIRASVYEALDSGGDSETLHRALWQAGRSQARARLEGLAQRIQPVAQWDDLVLPPAEKAMLQEISSHVKHRAKVYESWGFGGTSRRGLGISAMFAGSSGTGKTMAAEVLANTLLLDLYRIDLSSVISKYIGETEKNLRRVFDAAEEGGAILFFDEADALFGKRSEVKDSHDRYANIEVNYLLQRMESYRGLAVLATNMRSALDPAFLRRIRFVVNFPFPDFSYREQIWQRVFPPATPVESLDASLLARVVIPGGNIRNIAMNAAFRAAEEGTAVRMKHLAQAARHEFVKMEKPIPETEIVQWESLLATDQELSGHAQA
jgi:ATPase family associated with various cellular activities (AAA)/Winged helix domain, variant